MLQDIALAVWLALPRAVVGFGVGGAIFAGLYVRLSRKERQVREEEEQLEQRISDARIS